VQFRANDTIKRTAYYNLVVARPLIKKGNFSYDWYVTQVLAEFAVLFGKREYIK
jgi:hypothetical protein